MLLKYRIIFYAIILCLFGLTLMTVSPVFAQQGSGDSIFLNSGKMARELRVDFSCVVRWMFWAGQQN